jgi:serine/threonine-protein kinase
VQEARAASALNHPNIITIHEIDQSGSTTFIASEFVDGSTLRERIKAQPLSSGEVLDVAVQIASALAAAHAQGIVHRDIKPENIIIRRDGIVKVLDFGLAKLTGLESLDTVECEAPTRANLKTGPGVVMGTAAYMSPEQARGLEVDARSDVFSLGVVIYESLTGHLPFEGSNIYEIVAAILNERESQSLSHYSPEVPGELERIVAKSLRKNRDKRYQTTKDLLLDLQSLRGQVEFEKKLESSRPSSQLPQQFTESRARRPSRDNNWGSLIPVRRTQLLIMGLLLIVVGAGLYVWWWKQARANQPEIKSLAVLPLKSLDAGDNYLGLGIADAAIRRISQTGKVIVRPTSAVRRYLNEDTDALSAAKQLGVDSVLEGSFQRADDRLRVNVNLLRTSDGVSLWSNSFDLRMTDIFTIQDTVAQQVASHLRLQLDASQQAQLAKRYTSNAIAYELYLKGALSFDQRISASRASIDTTIGFFKQATEIDPNFALAHAQLAYTYATMSTFLEPTELAWAERAREEINRAQELDPQLAETHLASFQLLFSAAEGYQVEAAIREVLTAQQLNPSVGHAELGFLFFHIGFEDAAARELRRAYEIDPTSEFVKDLTLATYQVACKYDQYFEDRPKLYPGNPPVIDEAWYLMNKGHLDEAEKKLEELAAGRSDALQLPHKRALLSALKGDFRTAEAAVPSILNLHPRKDPLYHHATYDIASIYALEGKSTEAVKWLRETAVNGFQPYSLFECDPNLNHIRQAPEFIQFLTEMKALHEKYEREFGEHAA